MTRDEFLSLPGGIAMRLLFDALPEDVKTRALSAEKPRIPFSPKYDLKIFRKDGFQWASETNLESLRYWHDKAAQSAAGGGQYAEKDKKKADNLQRWIAWRECFPDAAWSGERDRAQVTAQQPSGKPMVYSSQRNAAPPAGETAYDPDSEIPF